MTETEYIKVKNLARIDMAQAIIMRILPDYGVTREELAEIVKKLEAISERIAKQIKLKQ